MFLFGCCRGADFFNLGKRAKQDRSVLLGPHCCKVPSIAFIISYLEQRPGETNCMIRTSQPPLRVMVGAFASGQATKELDELGNSKPCWIASGEAMQILLP